MHTFTIYTLKTERYRAVCDTCNRFVHRSRGVQQRDLAAYDAQQHARLAHGASDSDGNDTAIERHADPVG